MTISSLKSLAKVAVINNMDDSSLNLIEDTVVLVEVCKFHSQIEQYFTNPTADGSFMELLKSIFNNYRITVGLVHYLLSKICLAEIKEKKVFGYGYLSGNRYNVIGEYIQTIRSWIIKTYKAESCHVIYCFNLKYDKDRINVIVKCAGKPETRFSITSYSK